MLMNNIFLLKVNYYIKLLTKCKIFDIIITANCKYCEKFGKRCSVNKSDHYCVKPQHYTVDGISRMVFEA